MKAFLASWVCAIVLGVAPARAFEITDPQGRTLELMGWTQAGYQFVWPVALPFEHDAYLGLARFAARMTHKPWGRGFVQVEGASDDVRLLDLVAELTPSKNLAIRFGKFKVPTSADFLVPGPSTPFVNRSFGVDFGLVQKRLLGGELVARHRSRSALVSVQAGWFVPDPTTRSMLPKGEGNFLSLRGLVELDSGLDFHLAWTGLVLADNVSPTSTTQFPGPPRPVEYDRPLDAALVYKAAGWTIDVEGVVVLDGPKSKTPYALYAEALKSFDVPDTEFSLEPGLRYDIVRLDDGVRHRGTAGLTLYLVGDYLNASTNYEFSSYQGNRGHAAYAQIQAGF